MSAKESALQDMHKLFLEALRHREQEILHYLAFLGPAIGGFVWLLYVGANTGSASATQTGPQPTLSPGLFVVGASSVLLLLLLGAIYSLALGYNYRYITLQLAKLEAMLQITQYTLEAWPRSRRQFISRYRMSTSIPRCVRRWLFGRLSTRAAYRRVHDKAWCTPPEIIKVFWWAFLLAMIGVSAVASVYRPTTMFGVIPVLFICLVIGGMVVPRHYGEKLHRQCQREPEWWPSSA